MNNKIINNTETVGKTQDKKTEDKTRDKRWRIRGKNITIYGKIVENASTNYKDINIYSHFSINPIVDTLKPGRTKTRYYELMETLAKAKSIDRKIKEKRGNYQLVRKIVKNLEKIGKTKK